MSFSRIYQGRVSCVEAQDASVESGWRVIEDWQGRLWRHHELFQDAVNYYSAALYAMAASDKSPLWEARTKLPDVWDDFLRKGQKRRGMRQSLGRCFGIRGEELSIDACFERILKGNTSSPELLELALRELLVECDGEGAIQQKGREMLPRFCWAGFRGSYPRSKSQFERAAGETRLQSELHYLESEDALKAFAAEVQLAWVVNVNDSVPAYEGRESVERLRKALDHFLQAFGGSASTKMGGRVRSFLSEAPEGEASLLAIKNKVERTSADEAPIIPKNRKSIPDRSEALLLFKHFPSTFTADLLRLGYPEKKAPSKKRDEATQELIRFGDDPIFLARGERGYIFPAFSALPIMGGDEVEPTWKEFDIAAFKEALKALHQVEVKTEERRKKREELESQLRAQLEGGNWKPKGESEDEVKPPLLKDDPRMGLVGALLENTAIRNEFTGPDGVVRGLSKRGMRGYRELREKWNKIAPYGSDASEERVAKLEQCRKEFQAQQGDKQGDSALFKALVEPKFWEIWQNIPLAVRDRWRQEAGVKSNLEYADDILKACEERKRLEEEIERLEESIRFTPADAKYSQRQFYFSDVCSFTPKGRYHHEQKSMRVVVPLALENGGSFSATSVRLTYSAPRLLRDGLRGNGTSLKVAPFSQPMMKALGISDEMPQDIHKHAVALMPKLKQRSEKNSRGEQEEWAYLLNFPIALDTEKLRSKLGKSRFDWSSQFASFDGKHFYLLWPSLIQGRKEPKAGWWWEKVGAFSYLSVDLGQRDAAAYAYQEASRDGEGRVIGKIGGVEWKAKLKEMGMLKLPGEDAVYQNGNGAWKQEPYGSRGRLSDDWELAEACEIAKTLGQGRPEQSSVTYWKEIPYPKANDELLRLLRRSQGWLARIRGYCLDLAIDEKREAALDAIWADERLASQLVVPQKREAALVRDALASFIEDYRAAVARSLVKLTNRILPLRNGVWEWVTHPNAAGCHLLRRNLLESTLPKRKIAGQRGLSLERIEQLERLRQRIQSLNRVMRYAPADPESRRSLKGVELPDPCPDILEKLERLKEQRVKQTAHMILAQALGVRLTPHQLDKKMRCAGDVHGEYKRFRDRAADFIVVEDLSGYRSRQDKAPSENTRLMQWSHRALLDTLKELCGPYGIQVVEANAAYSSKFCSRTSEAGFRAREVSIKDFQRGGRYAHLLSILEQHRRGERSLGRERVSELQFFEEVAELLRSLRSQKRTCFVPEDGGPVFVSTVSKKWVQADVNAAINVGFRGVAEPSRHEFFPKIRTERVGESTFARADSKREKARWAASDREVALSAGEAGSETTSSPNLFVDRLQIAKFGRGRIGQLDVATSLGLWRTVKLAKWGVCREINKAKVAELKCKPAADDEEDVSY